LPVLDAAQLQEILTSSFPDSDVPRVEQVLEDEVTLVADTAAWMAILAQIGPVLLAVTTSLHIDFLRKPEITDLVARAKMLKLGRKLAVVEVSLFSLGHDQLVAKAQVTYAIPTKKTEGESQ